MIKNEVDLHDISPAPGMSPGTPPAPPTPPTPAAVPAPPTPAPNTHTPCTSSRALGVGNQLALLWTSFPNQVEIKTLFQNV